MALWRALFVLSLVATRVASGATTCPNAQGRAAPDVTTLFVAPDDANASWILQPDCSLEVIKIETANNGVPMLNCSTRGIQRVESISATAQLLHLEGNPLMEVDLSNATSLYQLILAWCNLTTVDTFKFPTGLGIIDLDGNNLQGLAKDAIPAKVKTMYISRNKLISFANFSLPAELWDLHIDRNNLTSLDFTIPAGLTELYMDTNNALKTIENASMPNSLTKLTCQDCAIETFLGVQLSSQLKTMDFTGSTLTELEVRDSDVDILKKVVFKGAVEQTKCSNPKAKISRVQSGVNACVISDAAFDAKYLGITSSSGSISGDGSSNTPSPTSTPTSPESSSSSSTTVIIIVAVAVVVCIVVGFVVFRRCRAKATSAKDIGSNYQETKTTEAAGSSAVATAASGSTNDSVAREYFTNDIRTDEAILSYRIAYEDIQILRVIGKGGFGIVHLAKFRGRRVAIKQVLPDKAKDMRIMRSFMDEIRLCASLEHPRIVEFIGLRWSTLQDIAVVNEYMEGGDLHAVLQKQQTFDPVEWFERSATLKAKSSLALDVVVALVYLHSFDQPIIHRDLKTRNVLLNGDGDAKLSDFGTSREALLDETMTGEIGTLAWIAPEVLRGERYSEKADIYSLGVLLVELDTASHPYRNAISEQNGSPISNTRIALMVSAGKLAPSVTPSCPPDIAVLIRSCLSYDQQSRPSAMEMHYELRKVMRNHSS